MTRRNWIVAGVLQLLLVWLAQPAQAADRVKVAMMDQQQVIERSVAGKRALEDLKKMYVAFSSAYDLKRDQHFIEGDVRGDFDT